MLPPPQSPFIGSIYAQGKIASQRYIFRRHFTCKSSAVFLRVKQTWQVNESTFLKSTGTAQTPSSLESEGTLTSFLPVHVKITSKS